ncbi:hypothetical protein G9A89_005305 [Geosiphon pyriformis]|nr:hypothetical protein G9A89_005305 [Geosiphon pyriformis]
MTSKYLSILCNDFAQMLENSDDYNVIIEVGEAPDIRFFKAHNNILKARCPYFRAALSSKWSKFHPENGMFVFRKPNVSPAVFAIILKYIYTGLLSLSETASYDIMDLLITADEMVLMDLFDHVQEYLISFRSNWILNNFTLVCSTAFQYDRFNLLQTHCLDLLCKDAAQFFQPEYMSFVNETFLISVLQRPDLEMDEIDLWKYLIDWGIAQTKIPYSRDDLSKWSDDEFSKLKLALANCIPLVRFSNILPNQYHRHIKAFHRIFPCSLLNELQLHFSPNKRISFIAPPPRMNGINSVLLKTRHLALLGHWIGRKDSNPFKDDSIVHDFRTLPYQLKLLLRGTRDGFSPSAFHNNCDNQEATVVVMKIQNNGHLIGGYNPFGWNSGNKWGSARNSFIFSLSDGVNLQNAILSRVQDPKRAVLCSQAIGACFGSGDLVMGGYRGDFDMDLACSSNPQSYEHPITDLDRFSVEEYEVFKVVRRLKTCRKAIDFDLRDD